MKHWKIISVVVLFALLMGAISMVSVGTGRGIIPFIGICGEWSIGIYTGDSLFSLAPPKAIKTPVLTAGDVQHYSCTRLGIVGWWIERT